MSYIKPVKAGDLITVGLLNRIVDQIERFASIRSGSPYLLLDDSPHGKLIELALPVPTWALLSGSSSPYSFTEVRDGPGGTWVSMPNGDSGTANVYEVNGKSGLAGKVVPITWTAAGDWRFQWVGVGPAECLWTFIVRDLCTSKRLPGSLVSVSQGGIEIANCTTTGQVISATRTAAGSNYTGVPTVTLSGGSGSGATAVAVMRVASVARTSGGSGYTDGTHTDGTFVGDGTGATFTYSVSGGVVQAGFLITAGGSGYTTTPTPVLGPAAGAGTGAVLTSKLSVNSLTLTAGGSGYLTAPSVGFSGAGGSGATGTTAIAAQCTLDVPVGDYDVTITPPADMGYAAYSGSLSHTCGQTTTTSLDVDTDHLCSGGCGPTDTSSGAVCVILPKTASLTWTFNPGYTGLLWPDADLAYDPTILGSNPAYVSDRFEFPGFSQGYRYSMACLGGSIGYQEQNMDGTWPTGGFLLGNTVGATVTCAPFAILNGTYTGGGTWDLIA